MTVGGTVAGGMILAAGALRKLKAKRFIVLLILPYAVTSLVAF